MTAYYIDLTALLARRNNINGAMRVDYELVGHYLKQDNARFFHYYRGKLVILSRKQVEYHIKAIADFRQQDGSVQRRPSADLVEQAVYVDKTEKVLLGKDTIQVTDSSPKTAWVVVRLRNTGIAAWRSQSIFLSTILPSGRTSTLATKKWACPTKPVTADREYVPPGETSVFKFSISIPRQAVVEEFFGLINEDGLCSFSGKVRLVVTHTNRKDLFRVKFKNRIVLAREAMARYPSFHQKAVFATNKSVSILLSKSGNLLSKPFFLPIKYLTKSMLLKSLDVLRWSMVLMKKMLEFCAGLTVKRSLLLFSQVTRNDVVLICSGHIGDSKYSKQLANLGKKTKVVQVIHDMLPIVAPQFSTGQDYCLAFEKHYKHIVSHAYALISTSANTSKDIRRQLGVWNIRQSIPIVTNRHGQSLRQVSSSPPPKLVKHSSFVLIVSEIGVNKNHSLLTAVYRLAEQRGIKLPHLYMVAGSINPSMNSLVYRCMTDNYLQKQVTILEAINDVELVWLYRNCLFTVYTSYFEGWGLPVAESLAHGKVTLSSNATSLPEVGGEFADYFSPYSTDELLNLMVRYTTVTKRTKRETEIKSGYKALRWNTSMARLATKIDRLVEAEPNSAKKGN